MNLQRLRSTYSLSSKKCYWNAFDRKLIQCVATLFIPCAAKQIISCNMGINLIGMFVDGK